jgi:hypothetical protein
MVHISLAPTNGGSVADNIFPPYAVHRVCPWLPHGSIYDALKLWNYCRLCSVLNLQWLNSSTPSLWSLIVTKIGARATTRTYLLNNFNIQKFEKFHVER